MSRYQRAWQPGGTWFFTVNLSDRRRSLLTDHITVLRRAVRQVQQRHPFIIHGWVVLPEHLHCVLELPAMDSDFALRWRLIKGHFSRSIPTDEFISLSRRRHGERGIWQRRYWEHRIRNERDYRMHMDYLHFNPVKHGWVTRVRDWPYSTFHRLVAMGVYAEDWGGGDGGLGYLPE